MKKKALGLLLTIILVALIVPISFSGCGTSGTMAISDPVAFFGEAREKTRDAFSFRVSGKYGVEYTGLPSSGKQDWQVDMLYEKRESSDSIIKISINISGEGTAWSSEMPEEVKLEGYAIADRIYLQDPYTGDWYYEEQWFGPAMSNIGQGLSAISPQTIMEMIDAAGEIEVIEENEKLITYALTLDPDKYFKDSFIEELKEEFRKRGRSEEEIGRNLLALRILLEAMEIVIEIDKESGRMSRYELVSSGNILEAISLMSGEENVPEDASMEYFMDLRFSEYGQAFDLELPEEAKNAMPLEETE